MKKLVCGCFGNIYYAKILKGGLMSSNDRVELTDDAVNAVIDHLASMDMYNKQGFSGYDIPKKNGGELKLRLYDSDKYVLARKVKDKSEAD